MSLLGIDVGSTGCKVNAYTVDGYAISEAYREYPVKYSNKTTVLDADAVWASIIECIQIVSSNCERDTVEAVSVSAMADTFTPISSEGTPITDSFMSFDLRAVNETHELKNIFDQEMLYEITGMPLHPMNPASKLFWLKNNNIHVTEKAWKYLFYEDFVIWKLCGEAVCSYSIAGRTSLFNNETTNWEKSLLGACSVDEKQLPTVAPSGIELGIITKKASEITGLPSTAKIVSGGFDQACCAAACGITKNNEIIDTTGTNEILYFLTQNEEKSSLLKNNLSYSYHISNNEFASFGHIFNAGGAFKWYKSLFYSDESISYADIIKKVPAEPSKVFFLPFLSGIGSPEMDYERNALFYGLSLSSDRYELSKSILEGITMECKYNFEMIEDIKASPIEYITSIGGAAKSDYWIQLKADILGIRIESFTDFEPGTVGSAILAGVGIGKFKDIYEGFNIFKKSYKKKIFFPDIEKHKHYIDKFIKYKYLREKFKNIYLT